MASRIKLPIKPVRPEHDVDVVRIGFTSKTINAAIDLFKASGVPGQLSRIDEARFAPGRGPHDTVGKSGQKRKEPGKLV